LLRERRQIAVTRQPEHLDAFTLDRLGERADAGTRNVLGAKIFVDDDDGKTELHAVNLQMERPLAELRVLDSSGLSKSVAMTFLIIKKRQVFGSVTPICP